jgi:SAM-dependent methyltransferase
MTNKPDYGVDAPLVPLAFGACGVALIAVWATGWGASVHVWMPLAGAAWFFAIAASFLYTTRIGKLAIWTELVRDLGLRGDERVLDLGCGRGLVLLRVAAKLTTGKSVGVDLWSTQDQSGNREAVTRRNAELEGVADRVELHTGDMRELAQPDAAFDVVVSSLAIHNIRNAVERRRAIDQAVRVLRPGGRLLIADLGFTASYAARLRELGMSDVAVRGFGWRFWYGGPWAAAKLVTATKPATK